MMNTSCSGDPQTTAAVTTLEYRDIAFATPPDDANHPTEQKGPARVSLTEEELGARIRQAVQTATQELEQRLREKGERELQEIRTRLVECVERFQRERNEYYARVEPELVHMVLAVAAKVLHREAQVDRMLLAALAKVAVENLQQRSNVVLRVAPEACTEWREFFAAQLTGTRVEILEDSELDRNGCRLETELGSADVGIEAQLKEIERGFFDLLAARPETR